MDQETYLKLLSQVAEYTQKKIKPYKPYKPKGQEPSEPDVEDQEELEESSVESHCEQNTTTPIELTRVIYQPSNCPDCGLAVECLKRERKQYEGGGRHWRDHCLNCDLTKHPKTGLYSLTRGEANRLYTTMQKNRGIYKSKEPQAKIAKDTGLQPSQTVPMQVQDLEDSVIYYYDKTTSE